MSRKALHDDWIFRASENITKTLKWSTRHIYFML